MNTRIQGDSIRYSMSWGLRITFLYVGFVLLIAVMVSMAMRQKIDLVSKDYYEQELRYQEKIERMINANALPDQLQLKQDGADLTIVFPAVFEFQNLSGTVCFFRPSDNSLDITIPVNVTDAGQQVISMDSFKPGLYHVQISWTSAGKGYFVEKSIQIL